MPENTPGKVSHLEAFYNEVDDAIEEGLKQHSQKLNINDEDKRFLLRLCGITLENHFHKKKVTKGDFDHVPKGCLQKIEKGYIFVSLYLDGVLKACQSMTTGDHDLFDATVEATQYSIKDKRYDPPAAREDLERMVIDLDVMFNPVEMKDKKYLQIRKKIKLGLQGVSIINSKLKKAGMFKNNVPLEHEADFIVTMKRLKRKAKMTTEEYQNPATKVFLFDTLNFYTPYSDLIEKDGAGFQTLYRRNIPTRMSEINKERLESTLWNMLTYIDRNITDEGRLNLCLPSGIW